MVLTQYLYIFHFYKRSNLFFPLCTNQFLRGTICFWVKLYKTFILISQSSEIGIPQFDGSFSVQMIEPKVGDKLDPDQHQAMSVEESHDVSSNCVSKVIQKGYSLNNRLLRPAMVVVAKAPGKTAGKG